MQSPLHLHKYPFLRFLVPLILGVYFAHSFLQQMEYDRIIISLLIGIYAITLLGCLFIKRYSYRWLNGVSMYLLLFILGIATTYIHQSANQQYWEINRTTYIGEIIDYPKIKEHSTFCLTKLLAKKENSTTYPINKKIALYLTNDSLSQSVKRGNQLLFYGRITAPHNNGNPEEFDYASFLSHQGITGTAFASSGQWQIIGNNPRRDIRQIALDIRSGMLTSIKKLGFSGDEYTVLSALVLGYQDELSQEIRESYSISGVSHVLSLSGLHIGFLYVLLDLLLRFANYNRKTLIAKQLFIILFLWFFAFITGLLSPVIRSVIMFSIIALSKVRSNPPSTLNTLAAAAVMMLIYNPFYLYDVSFQLSFTAVAGIVLLQPLIYNKIKVNNKIGDYIWSLMSVSIAAQLITAPIVLYYFSRFATHFLLSNILVIPITSVIMYLAVITLFIGFLPIVQQFLADVLLLSIKLLNGTVSFIEHLPYASINQLCINQIDILLLYLILFFSTLYLFKHRRKYMLPLLLCVFLFLSSLTIEKYKHQHIRSITFYNVRNCPAVHLIESQKTSYLFATKQDSILPKLHYATNRYWDKLHLSTPKVLPFQYHSAHLWRHNNILSFQGKTICIANDSTWKNKCSDKPFNVDYLYLCKGYKGKLLWLMPLFNIHQVVIDSSINNYKKEKFKRECTLLGLNFISLAEKGAYHIAF